MTQLNSGVPVEVIFNPNWWFRNYGVSFDESFYLDREKRIANDVVMRRALFERFGFGEGDAVLAVVQLQEADLAISLCDDNGSVR